MLCDPQRHLILHCKKKSRNDIDNKDTKYVKDTRGSAGRYGYSNGRGKSSIEAGMQDWNKKHKNGKRLKKIKRMTENLGNYHVDESAHNFFIY